MVPGLYLVEVFVVKPRMGMDLDLKLHLDMDQRSI